MPLPNTVKVLLLCRKVEQTPIGDFECHLELVPRKNEERPTVSVTVRTPMSMVPGNRYELMLCGLYVSNHDVSHPASKCVDVVRSFRATDVLNGINYQEEIELMKAEQAKR